MWIICCGMIRSGSTLQYQIASDLVEQHGLGKRIEYFPETEFHRFYSDYRSRSGYKVIKAHICTSDFESLFARGEALGFYSYRDLRDVAVSAIRKFSISFEELMSRKWLDLAVQQGSVWRGLSGVSISKYEEMISDLPAEVARAAKELGLTLSDRQAAAIAEEYNLDKQRQRTKRVIRRAGEKDSFDRQTLLHHNHIHFAEIGGWKSQLSPVEIKVMETRYGSWLRGNGYELSSSDSL